MENPEEILHSLEEFSKMKPKDIPRELEEYLCFVAKTGNPIYQWPIVKSLFREKLINVITDFYETCPTMDIPPCPNVEMFNYDMMKNFILEKLDTFAAAPFTVQRICELLTSPRKEYNRIDKYMRALEKNILVVSTTEPGRRSNENGEGIMNGIESEHLPESSSHDINIEDMDESPSNWSRHEQVTPVLYKDVPKEEVETVTETTSAFENEPEAKEEISSTSTIEETKPLPQETVITCTSTEETIDTYEPADRPENTYQNLSEESNSSDSSSSASASESKETVPEEKEPIEEVLEAKVETIVPKEDQDEEIVEEPIVTESKLDPITPPNDEATVESSQSEEKPEAPLTASKDTLSENSSESQTTETSSISDSTSEAEGKPEEPEKVQSPVEEKEEIKVAHEEPVSSVMVEGEAESVVDSSTDIEEKKEETLMEKSEETLSETKETDIKDSNIVTGESEAVKDKAEDTPTPMEIDVRETSQEKKVESEEPSSSVETFVKLMSAYYSRD